MTHEEWIEHYNQFYVNLIRAENKGLITVDDVNKSILGYLIENCTEAKKQYYNVGSDFMEDMTYDMFERWIKVHDPNHPFLDKIGTDVNKA